MRITVEVAGREWTVDGGSAVEIGIALGFDGEQARAFGLSPARREAVVAGDFVGDTRRGGSANCETLTLTPHGNGTHTEVVGHITVERICVADAVVEPLLAASLLTVQLRTLQQSGESYAGTHDEGDLVICRGELEQARREIGLEADFLKAVVIRCDAARELFEPLDDHSGTNPPYLTVEAVRWLREVGCDHLLVEIPSVDREDDGGALSNHHVFFGFEPGEPADSASRRRTITEMIRVPDEASDGRYVLSLRFPRLETDAAPSRPVIYPLRERS